MVKKHLVIGPPGTGKTTYVAKQVRRAMEKHGKVLVASFTKAAAVELAGRGLGVDPDCVGTLHKICLHALGRPKLAVETLKEFAVEHPQFDVGTVDVDADVGVMAIAGNNALSRLDTLRSKMIPKKLWAPQDLYFDTVWSDWKAQTGSMDFTDLIERSITEVPVAPGNPKAIFYDEAQDGSKLELALLNQWSQSAEHTVMVGDEDQTLYRWRGADPETFLAFSDHPIIRDQSYRLPHAVWHESMRWIHQIPVPRRLEKAYKPREAPGVFVRSHISMSTLDDLIPAVQEDLDAGMSVMILASTNRHVGLVTREFKTRGMPFENRYRPQRTDWNIHFPIPKTYGMNILKGHAEVPPQCHDSSTPQVQQNKKCQWTAFFPQLFSGNDFPLITSTSYLRYTTHKVRAFLGPSVGQAWTWRALEAWMGMVKKKAIIKHPSSEDMLGIEDQAVPFERLTEFIPERVIEMAEDGDLSWLIENSLARFHAPLQYPQAVVRNRGVEAFMLPARVTVGTIHSVKGTEADSVYVFPDLSRAAHEGWEGSERDDIVRTFYVAMTRAREKLTLCAADNWRSVRWLPVR